MKELKFYNRICSAHYYKRQWSNQKNNNKKEKKSEFFSFIHPINHAPLSKNDHPHAYKSESSELMSDQAKSAPT